MKDKKLIVAEIKTLKAFGETKQLKMTHGYALGCLQALEWVVSQSSLTPTKMVEFVTYVMKKEMKKETPIARLP